MKIEWPLALAALLMLATCLAHVFLGTGEYLQPSLSLAMSAEWIAMQSILWHGVTALLAACTVALGWASLQKVAPRALLVFVVVLNAAFGVVFAFFAWTVAGGFLVMPQWIAFAAIVAFAGLGLRLRNRSTSETEVE